MLFKRNILILNIIPIISFILIYSCSGIIRLRLTNKDFIDGNHINSSEWEKFYWSADTISGVYTTKAALYLPVIIPGVKHKTAMQLDLGSSSSVLYKKTLDFLKSNIKDSLSYATKINIQINDCERRSNKIKLKELGGGETVQLHYKIGNLGLDYFLGKILIIDYKNERFKVLNNLPNDYIKDFSSINNVSINKFPILLPANINGKKVQLMFDTGSSIFNLLTYPQNFNMLANNNSIDTSCCVKAFGKVYNIQKSHHSGILDFMGEKHADFTIFSTNKFDEDKKAVFGMKMLDIFGITGNYYFFEKTIVLDFKHNQVFVK